MGEKKKNLTKQTTVAVMGHMGEFYCIFLMWVFSYSRN